MLSDKFGPADLGSDLAVRPLLAGSTRLECLRGRHQFLGRPTIMPGTRTRPSRLLHQWLSKAIRFLTGSRRIV